MTVTVTTNVPKTAVAAKKIGKRIAGCTLEKNQIMVALRDRDCGKEANSSLSNVGTLPREVVARVLIRQEKEPEAPQIWIVNSDRASSRGTHWGLLVISADEVIIIDPLFTPQPGQGQLFAPLATNLSENLCDRQVRLVYASLQSDATTCGAWCAFVLRCVVETGGAVSMPWAKPPDDWLQQVYAAVQDPLSGSMQDPVPGPAFPPESAPVPDPSALQPIDTDTLLQQLQSYTPLNQMLLAIE